MAAAAQSAASPSLLYLAIAITTTCAGCWWVPVTFCMEMERRADRSQGDGVPPGMSVPEPLDRDYVEEQR